MSQADKLLASLYEGDVSEYIVNSEDEPHIVISDDRYISVPDVLKRIAVEKDHNIETVIFDCPRYWDGHDLSTMKIFINYMCANKKLGAYPTKTVWVDDNNDSLMHFEWVISDNVTQAAGTISFLVCAKRTTDDGKLENHWNSELNTEMYVSKGLEAVEEVLDLQPDILTHVLLLADVMSQRAAVYVGSGEMPEGYNVQIDPTGGFNMLKVKDVNGKIINIPYVTGPQGPRGEQGVQGEVGPQGEQGVQGERGFPGVDLSIGLGDIIETTRTDLGENWLLCNGDIVKEGEYPELREVLPYNTDWRRFGQFSLGYETVRPLPVAGQWVLLNLFNSYNPNSTGKSAILYDASTDTYTEIACPTIDTTNGYGIFGLTHDGSRYILGVNESDTLDKIHLFTSTDLATWTDSYQFSCTSSGEVGRDLTFDGIDILVAADYYNNTSTYSTYVYAINKAMTTKTARISDSRYSEEQFFRVYPSGYWGFRATGGTSLVVYKAGSIEQAFSFSVVNMNDTPMASTCLAFFSDKYWINVPDTKGTSKAYLIVCNLETMEVAYRQLYDFWPDISFYVGGAIDGMEYDKNTNMWKIYFRGIMKNGTPEQYYIAYISADSDPNIPENYTVVQVEAHPDKIPYGQMHIDGTYHYEKSTTERYLRDPNQKYLPTNEDSTPKYISAVEGNIRNGEAIADERIEEVVQDKLDDSGVVETVDTLATEFFTNGIIAVDPDEIPPLLVAPDDRLTPIEDNKTFCSHYSGTLLIDGMIKQLKAHTYYFTMTFSTYRVDGKNVSLYRAAVGYRFHRATGEIEPMLWEGYNTAPNSEDGLPAYIYIGSLFDRDILPKRNNDDYYDIILAFINIPEGTTDFTRDMITDLRGVDRYCGYARVKTTSDTGTGGSGIDVTAEVGQTIVVTEVDSDGKPTNWKAADYQPRTHWTEEEIVLPEATYTVDTDGFVSTEAGTEIALGDICVVTYNGVTYECVATEFNGGAVIGNYAALSDDDNVVINSGEPFVAAYDESGWSFGVFDGSTEITVSIVKKIITKIPNEYIADNYYVYEISGDAFNNRHATIKEVPVALLEAMEARKPIYLKITETVENLGYSNTYFAPAQYSGVIDYAMMMVDRTKETYIATGLFDLCWICLFAYINDTLWGSQPYYIMFRSDDMDAE